MRVKKYKNFEIPFNSNLYTWFNIIKKAFKTNNIIYSDRIINNMCKSLNYIIIKYLSSMGYRPKNTYEYRVDLAKRLRKYGLKIYIRSNKLLWEYLECFEDLEDYSKCFDISIEIEDLEKACKDIIYVSVKPLNNLIEEEDINEENRSRRYINTT